MSSSLSHQPTHTPAHLAPDEEPSIGELVQGVTTSFSTIIRGEIELAKLELRGTVKNAGLGVGFFVVAGAMIFFSLFYLFFAFGWGLNALGLPLWGSFLIVFGVLFLVGAVAGLIGFQRVRRVQPPQKTISTTKETITYLKGHAPKG